jgi:DNA repair exonuclease SbcCD nuclease subunit
VEIVAAPWHSKRPRADLVAAMVAGLAPAPPGTIRIGVAHGMVEGFTPKEAPETIARAGAEEALRDGRLHYLALGDRHSATEVAPRMWYSGAPEATDFREVEPGHALVVDVGPERCTVTRHRTGAWRFHEAAVSLETGGDVAALDHRLGALEGKGTMVLRLTLTGGLRVGDRARLDDLLAHARDVFAGVQERSEELVVLAGDDEVHELGLTGFARATVQRLADRSATSLEARDALTLLYRLAGGRAAEAEAR